MSRADRTRAALVPIMGPFLEGLSVMDVAGFGPMSMDDWTEADCVAAIRWVGIGAVGEPPPKVAEYIQGLRESCGATPAEWLTEPVDSPFRVVTPELRPWTWADVFASLDLKPAPPDVRAELLRNKGLAFEETYRGSPGSVGHLEAVCKRHDPSAEIADGDMSVLVVTSLDEDGAAALRAELEHSRPMGVDLIVSRRSTS